MLLLTGTPSRGAGDAPIVLATGAYDRPVAFPGWTLPGVMTAGGAQALSKGQGVLPGRRVLLAGAGPFLLPVAAQLRPAVRRSWRSRRRRAGATGCARARGWPPIPAGSSTTPATAQGAEDRLGHVIVRAEGDDRVRSATIAEAGADWAPSGRERTFEVDAVCTAYGFIPSVELARALGCELREDGVEHDDHMRTTRAGRVRGRRGLGDRRRRARAGRGRARGLHGRRARARSATARGRRAPDLPALPAAAKLAGFATSSPTSSTRAPACSAWREPDTVLCRCEDVTAGAVDAAVAGGATTMSALKIVTRCGQGPCQGRTCERLVGERLPEPERFSARSPIRPIRSAS